MAPVTSTVSLTWPTLHCNVDAGSLVRVQDKCRSATAVGKPGLLEIFTVSYVPTGSCGTLIKRRRRSSLRCSREFRAPVISCRNRRHPADGCAAWVRYRSHDGGSNFLAPGAGWNTPTVAPYQRADTSSEQPNTLHRSSHHKPPGRHFVGKPVQPAIHIEHMLYSRAMTTVKKKVARPELLFADLHLETRRSSARLQSLRPSAGTLPGGRERPTGRIRGLSADNRKDVRILMHMITVSADTPGYHSTRRARLAGLRTALAQVQADLILATSRPGPSRRRLQLQ